MSRSRSSFGRCSRRMLGVEPLLRPTVRAVCAEDFTSPEGKRQFARGWLSVDEGRYVVQPFGAQSSHLVNDLAHANCFVVVPESVDRTSTAARQ